MRPIDADALFAEFENADWYNNADRDEIAERLILQAPTIDAVSVVHGEWIEHKERTIVMDNNFVDFYPTEYECSNCGLREAHYFINSKPHNYCPNCGADMRGESDD